MELLAEQVPGLWFSFVFVFGALVGSFLNVVIARVPVGESVVSPPSRCPRCKGAIAWYDNVPLVSWILLRARCRGCGLPISSRYPLVEALGGLLAVAVAWRFGPTLEALGAFAFAMALVALAFIDLDTWLLPHELTWPLLGFGLISPWWNRGLGWRESAIGAAVGFGLFAGITLFGEKVLKRETMGWGDVWLLSAIGAWLGIGGIFPVVMLSALQGALVGGLLILLGRAPGAKERAAEAEAEAKANATPSPNPSPVPLAEISEPAWIPPAHAVPYGPFLALAALQQLLVGELLWTVWDAWVRRLSP